MATPSKEAQVAEATARSENGIQPGETTAAALDVVEDGARGAPQTDARTTPAEGSETRPVPPTRGLHDDKRAAIVARFRNDRTEAEGDRDEISDFARAGLPPDLTGQTEQADAQADADPALADGEADTGDQQQQQQQPEPVAAQPKTVRVKVFGKETEMSLEDVVAHAQKSLAADDVLDRAKSKARELDDIVETARNTVSRSAKPGANQSRDAAAETTNGSDQPSDAALNQERLHNLIETIQLGDPVEAQALLEKTIQDVATKTATNVLASERLKTEGTRTKQVLKDFEAQHQDLAKDSMARAAIEAKMFELQLEDLTALNVDLNKLPDRSPNGIALAHRWYRSEGYQTREPQDLLQKATDDFLAWKGVAPKPSVEDPEPSLTTTQSGQKPAPRIEVNLNRDTRRAAIPQQPSRASAPRQAQPAAPKPRDRSAIVQDMKTSRNGPRRLIGVS